MNGEILLIICTTNKSILPEIQFKREYMDRDILLDSCNICQANNHILFKRQTNNHDHQYITQHVY